MVPQTGSAATTHASPASKQIPELDGIRGLAIALVMSLHFVCSMILPQNAIELLLAKLTSYGGWGVDLFFVLSGFLITGILHDTKGAPRFLRSFYMRRSLRIFPLYYVFLLLFVVVIPAGWLEPYAPGIDQTRHTQVWLWTYLTNFYLAGEGSFSIPYISHFWSLAVEEHFYLFWPFIVGWLSRTATMRLCVFLALFSLAFRLSLPSFGYGEFAAHVLTPGRLDALCAGGYFALAARAPEGHPLVVRSLPWLAGSVALVLATSLFNVVYDSSSIRVVRESALALMFGFWIVRTARNSGQQRSLLGARWLRALGRYSYGIYVFHGVVAQLMLRNHTLDRLTAALGRGWALPLHTLVGVVVSCVVAIASYELFEVHFLRLKKWFEATPTRAGLKGTSEA